MAITVSIIIPAHNSAKTLKFCLKSLFKQTFLGFEIIVVNDGSTDETGAWLNGYIVTLLAEERAKIRVITQNNQGSNPARNRGAKEATGKYLLFCDADIEMRNDALEKMVNALEKNPDTSFVYSSFYFGWKKFKLWPYDIEQLKKMPYIHTTSLIRREHFPGFDNNIKRLQDWDLFLTMAEQGHKGIFIPEFLFKVRPRRHGISSWLPKFVYKFPWQKFGIKIKALEEYKQAEKIIKEKHNTKYEV